MHICGKLFLEKADKAATGENAVVVGCRHADIIVGPIGIVIADSLLGEITPKMALAVAQSDAKRVLIPFNHCDNVIVGVNDSDEFWNDLTIRIELQAIFEVLFSIVFIRKLTSRYGKICTSFNYNIAINGASFNFCRKLLTRLILNRRIKYISNLSVNHYAIAINYSFYRIVTAFSTPNCYALIFQ